MKKINIKNLSKIISPKILFLIIPILIIGISLIVYIKKDQISEEKELKYALEVLIPETVNKTLVNQDFKIKAIDNVTKVSSLYRFILVLEGKESKSYHYLSYITSDAKFFFIEGFDIEKISKSPESTSSATDLQ